MIETLPRIKSREFPGVPRNEPDFRPEPLVDLGDYFNGRVLVTPVYYKQDVPGAGNKCLAREGVARRLEKAMRYLPGGLSFQIFDAYRTPETQRALYDNYAERLMAENPGWGMDEAYEKAGLFVSPPSGDIKKTPVHITGGAVDLTLYSKKYDRALDMGTEFDDFSEKANTDWYEKHDPLDRTPMMNRRLLCCAMASAGFTNLPSEWWHFDYGDRFWAFYNDRAPIYGPCRERTAP